PLRETVFLHLLVQGHPALISAFSALPSAPLRAMLSPQVARGDAENAETPQQDEISPGSKEPPSRTAWPAHKQPPPRSPWPRVEVHERADGGIVDPHGN